MEHYNLFDQARKVPIENTIVETVPDADLFTGGAANPFMAIPQPQEPQSNNMNDPYQSGGNVRMNVGAQIPAGLAVDLLDKAGTALVTVICNLSGYTVKRAQIALTVSEKNMLEKPTEDYLKTLNVNLSPLEQFALCWAGVYAAKVITLVSDGSIGKRVKKTAKNEDADFDLLNEGNELTKRKAGVKPGTKRGSYNKAKKIL